MGNSPSHDFVVTAPSERGPASLSEGGVIAERWRREFFPGGREPVGLGPRALPGLAPAGGSPGPAEGGAPPEGGRRARGLAQLQKVGQGFLAELAERERG